MTIRPGTRIEVLGSPAVEPEPAVIARWTPINGPQPNHVHGSPGWHIVKFADGGKMCVHEGRIRVVDNRA